MQSYHTLIGGASDGGKSTLLREVHRETDCMSVWVNHNEEDNISGYRASGRKAMATATGKYDKWSNVKINLQKDDPLEGTDMAVDFAVDVWDTAGVPCQIIVDECHHVIGEDMGTARDNPGLWALAEGRDKGIKMVFASQNPQKLEYDEMLNFKYIAWVGEAPKAQEGFYRYWGFDQSDLPDEMFQYSVYNRQLEQLYNGETKEKFGDGS